MIVRPDFPLAADEWSLTIPDHAVSSVDGLPVDGETAGRLPSGDGVAGGTLELTFRVTRLPEAAPTEALPTAR